MKEVICQVGGNEEYNNLQAKSNSLFLAMTLVWVRAQKLIFSIKLNVAYKIVENEML